MNQQLINTNEAENDLLSCAAFLAENIKSSDGYAEAMKEIVPYYLAKNNVDLSAELADSIDDPFVRDQLLIGVSVKCAELNDDEYAIQLAEAMEEASFSGSAFEEVGKQKARMNQFEKATQIAENLEHASNIYAEIAIHQDSENALQTIDKIEFPFIKVHTLQEIFSKSGDLDLLEKATIIAQEIDLEEERIRAYLGISFQYIDADRKDKAIEVLDKARQFSETLDSKHRDPFLSQISHGFMKAGSLELADRALDLVTDKHEIAQALVGYAVEFNRKDERTEAVETLDEAYAILKSQRDTETRNSQAKYNLFGQISVHFAEFQQLEKAIEIANENPYEEIRNNSLAQIYQHSALQNNEDLAQQAIESINDDSDKVLSVLALSDARRKLEQDDEALKELNRAYSQVETIQQFSLRSSALNRIARRFDIFGETEKSRKACSESLETIDKILDESNRATALAELSGVFDDLKFELNEHEKDILQTMTRKATS